MFRDNNRKRTRGIRISKNYSERSTNPVIMPNTLRINGSAFDKIHSFSCGNNVPIYEVNTVHALNQLIGHAKFNNQSYGNVYYRGESKLHPSIIPSLFRNGKKIEKAQERINKLINKIAADQYMRGELKIDPSDNDNTKIKIEGMLQHYGVPTRFIDVVDNHWVALWMGLNKPEEYKQFTTYYHYTRRSIPLVELYNEKDKDNGIDITDEILYQYILLIAVPFSASRSFSGIEYSSDFIEVDLRQALPSIFLRPHAQHGLVLRRVVHQPDSSGSDAYDLANTVIGIIKIRIDRAHEWIGTGELLTQNNLFPPPAYDYGYDLLLSRHDLFKDSQYSITKYV